MMILPQIKRRKKKLAKKRMSESAKSDTEEVGHTYGIDRLKIVEAIHYSDDSEWHPVKHRIFQMENKINKDKSITHEFNVTN